MEKHFIQNVNVGEKITGISEKTNKPYEFTKVGLRINNTWHNGRAFKKSELDMLSESKGKEIYLELYSDEVGEKTYHNFRLPKIENADIIQRLEDFEKRLKAVETKIK